LLIKNTEAYILDCAVQIPNTVNSVKHPLVVLLVPLKHSLISWLLHGFASRCHPWNRFDRNRDGKKGVISNL
jgi:hypothetical protein